MMSATVYEARPLKRRRATKEEMEARREMIVELALEHGPCSVRHLFYRATVVGVPGIGKNKSGYSKVQRLALDLRRSGRIPYRLIVDNTRWMSQPPVWTGLDDVLDYVAGVYRRDLWASSDYRVEVWCESDSIAGTVRSVTDKWAVPLFVCRGQSSETFAYNAAVEWAQDNRIPIVLYIGDHDPAGLEIEQVLHAKLAAFYRSLLGNNNYPVHFERVAVTWHQVEVGRLPGTKPKKPYGYDLSVEAEALPPKELTALLDAAIAVWVDSRKLAVLRVAEASERAILKRMDWRAFQEDRNSESGASDAS